jgi:hypothetical protein
MQAFPEPLLTPAGCLLFSGCRKFMSLQQSESLAAQQFANYFGNDGDNSSSVTDHQFRWGANANPKHRSRARSG